ncbi:MAG: DUF2203 domain-containing protein [Ktedonobacteraceae bacterium]|nr:DUF2203 domain-containing protein [Ktedonobacteraceae bacterium]
MPHYFTREEAEALLPEITVILRKIQAIHQEMHTLEDDLSLLQAQALNNGHHLHERIMELRRNLAGQLQALRSAANELQEFGCVLKDPEMGLVDFLSLRDGQEVFLCWRLGEARISYWHTLDGGFAGRQPLD